MIDKPTGSLTVTVNILNVQVGMFKQDCNVLAVYGNIGENNHFLRFFSKTRNASSKPDVLDPVLLYQSSWYTFLNYKKKLLLSFRPIGFQK